MGIFSQGNLPFFKNVASNPVEQLLRDSQRSAFLPPPCKTEKKPHHYFFDGASDLRLDYCSSCTPREGEISWQVLRGLMSNDSEDFDWAGEREKAGEGNE